MKDYDYSVDWLEALTSLRQSVIENDAEEWEFNLVERRVMNAIANAAKNILASDALSLEHDTADAFWSAWDEHHEKHGFYESTWAGFRAAANSLSKKQP